MSAQKQPIVHISPLFLARADAAAFLSITAESLHAALAAAPQPPQAERVPMTEAEIDTAIKEVIELRMPNFPANCKNAAVEVAHAVAVAMQSRHSIRSNP